MDTKRLLPALYNTATIAIPALGTARALSQIPIVQNAYKNMIPMNYRMYARSINNQLTGNNKPFTEQDTTKKEVSSLKAAARDSKYYPNIRNKKVVPNSITYYNYAPDAYGAFIDRDKLSTPQLLAKPFKDTDFAALTGIGNAYLESDNKGTTHIKDTYDFERYPHTNTPYGFFHRVAEKTTAPVNVDIALNDDGNEYDKLYSNIIRYPDNTWSHRDTTINNIIKYLKGE